MSQDSIFNNDDEDILNNQDLGSFLEDNDFKYLELNTTNKYGLENEIDKKIILQMRVQMRIQMLHLLLKLLAILVILLMN
jgi:hypothetical protein